MRRISFPSKTFLLGEYAVLQGGAALLLGHPPLFTASLEAAQPAHPFHPESPAGKWLGAHPASGRITFQDAHGGKGGFGGSGAEFLAAWSANEEIPSRENPRAIFAWSAWEEFRALGDSGSGADILTQAFGVNREDAFFLHVDLSGRQLAEIFPIRTGGGELALFHTGKKLATHEQKTPDAIPVAELNELTSKAALCLEEGLFRGFAEAISAYGQKMAALGLQATHTAQALKGVGALDGVLGAKGCGAMGADVILVAHHGADFEAWATENSLALVGNFPV